MFRLPPTHPPDGPGESAREAADDRCVWGGNGASLSLSRNTLGEAEMEAGRAESLPAEQRV